MTVGRKVLADTAIYGGADFISKLVAFATFPLVATALSPEGFGAMELVLTITSLLGVLANSGTNNSIQRFYWDGDTPQRQRPLLVSTGATMLLTFQLGAVVLGVVAFAVFSAFGVVDHAYVGWLGALAALIMMAANQLSQYMLDVIRLHQAPWRFFGVSIVLRVATALTGVLAVAVLGYGLDVMLALQAMVAIAAVPLATAAVSRDIIVRFDWTFARQVFSYGHPFIYASMAFWLLSSIDRWMLASMSSVAEVGIYSAAFRYASIALFVSTAFGQAWSPMAMKLRADHPETYRGMYSDILLVLSAGMLVIGAALALFSSDLIALTMTPDYAAAAAPLAVLSLGVMLQATVQITAVGISIERKTYLFARLSWLTAVVNAAVNFALIPAWGALGAAWGTAIAYLLLTGSYLFFTQRLHPLPLKIGRLSILGLIWLVLVSIAGSGVLASADLALLPAKLGVLAICALACAAVIPWTRLRTASR
jgi:O-antigen/teichoic acid export membrane protein